MLKVQAIGFLGKDATKKEVSGKTVINFSVAHTEKFRDAAGNQKEKIIWAECAYWTDKTGILPYLVKGTQVYVEGNGDVRTWQSQDGKSGASLTIRVTQVQLLGSKQDNQQQAPASSYPSNHGAYTTHTAADVTEPVDDLPF